MACVIAGSSIPGIAKEIASLLNLKFSSAAVQKFPDNELHVEIDEKSVEAEDKVYYVHTMFPNPNEKLVELLLTCDLLRDLGCKKIAAVLPYLCYSRQDYRKHAGEAVSAKTFFKVLESVGVSEVISIDIHLHRLSLKELSSFTSIKLKELSAFPLLAESVKSTGFKNPVVISPDSEGGRFAELVAGILNPEKPEHAYMSKKRLTPTKVEVEFKGAEKTGLQGRNILFVDDIVSTGNTLIEAAKILKNHRVKEIHAAFTHAVFSTLDSTSSMFSAGISKLISTNTIPNQFSAVNVASLIAGEIGKELKRS